MKKKNKQIFIGGLVANPKKTTQCKHCGTPAFFVQEIKLSFQTSEWYVCPECQGLTQIIITG